MPLFIVLAASDAVCRQEKGARGGVREVRYWYCGLTWLEAVIDLLQWLLAGCIRVAWRGLGLSLGIDCSLQYMVV